MGKDVRDPQATSCRHRVIRHSVLGNAGTLIAFRVGATDAAYLAREFEPVFERLDLLNLPNYDIYLKLMIDGTPSKPFSATTAKHDELQADKLGSR